MSDATNPTIKNTKPLDPTRSGEDLLGDTTGMTGVTTGNAQQTSATPTDTSKDENKDHLPGGLLPDKEGNKSQVVAKEAVNDEDYKKNLQNGMSDVTATAAEDIATEDDIQHDAQRQDDSAPSISSDATMGDLRNSQASADLGKVPQEAIGVNIKNAAGDDSPGSDAINTETAPYMQPSSQGEQAVSGTMPDPASDDDTQANAHAMGMQLGEDDNQENPQELDIARDVDAAEEHIRTH